MLQPFAHGPTQLSGFLWWQGEANTKGLHCARSYQCLFPAMIGGWRAAFQQPSAYFGWVQLSTWCPTGEPTLSILSMRTARIRPSAGTLSSVLDLARSSGHTGHSKVIACIIV